MNKRLNWIVILLIHRILRLQSHQIFIVADFANYFLFYGVSECLVFCFKIGLLLVERVVGQCNVLDLRVSQTDFDAFLL